MINNAKKKIVAVLTVGLVLSSVWPLPVVTMLAFGHSKSSQVKVQASVQGVADLNLKLPFRPGSEWQTTAGWEADNHQQDWNWYAVDFVPVGRSCKGEPIIAAAPGRIVNTDTGAGTRFARHEVEIDHGTFSGVNYRTLYVHLDSITVNDGASVTYGTQIGTCGDWSAPQGAHLHFQLFQGRRWEAGDGIIPVPIDGITDQNRLTSYKRGLSSTNSSAQPPNPPLQINPEDNSMINTHEITLSWQDTGDPDNAPRNYRDFYAEVWKSDNSWNNTMIWQVTNHWDSIVPGDGTYYWHVKSGDGAQGSEWSSTRSFTVYINQAPNLPNMLEPGNASIVNSHTITLSWEDTGDPDNAPRTYRDYSGIIWKDDNSWSQEISWQTDTSWTGDVPEDGTYYWKIQSGDGWVGSGWTDTWSFTVSTIPDVSPTDPPPPIQSIFLPVVSKE